MNRDWQRARDAKEAYWTERVQLLGPLETLRIADELRRQVLLQHPDWPNAVSRCDDLRHHVRMTVEVPVHVQQTGQQGATACAIMST